MSSDGVANLEVDIDDDTWGPENGNELGHDNFSESDKPAANHDELAVIKSRQIRGGSWEMYSGVLRFTWILWLLFFTIL